MKKSFGQHYLKNKDLAKKIVSAAELGSQDLVVEVGPGQGILTREILDHVSDLILIEADRDLIPELEHNFSSSPLSREEGSSLPSRREGSTKIIHDDAAKVDYDQVVKDQPWKLISNLPYNAANAIIMKALASKNPPAKMVIMVQKEVAQRMIAKPGDMSLLSVAIQIYTDPKKMFDVKPGSFIPPPNVMSSVLILDLNKKCDDPESVIGLAKAGFSSRRKQLHKNLSDAGIASSQKIKQALLDLNLSEKSRAQELSTTDWVGLQSLP